MKTKILKRMIASLILATMATPYVGPSVGAVPPNNTSSAEMKISLDALNSLPNPEASDFTKKFVTPVLYRMVPKKPTPKVSKHIKSDKIRDMVTKIEKNIADRAELEYEPKHEILKPENLDINKTYVIKYKEADDTVKDREVVINEQKAYADIKKIVNDIKDKVEKMSGKNKDIPDTMYIANEIYKWVVTHIKYDYFTLNNAEPSDKSNSFRRPQNPYFVFDQKLGVCDGKANLLNLMMQMAGIPSTVISTNKAKGGFSHVYNAIYIETKDNAARTGWTLLDATWGASNSDMDAQTNQVNAAQKSIDKNITNPNDAQKIENAKQFDVYLNGNVFGKLTTANEILNKNVDGLYEPLKEYNDYLTELQNLIFRVCPYYSWQWVNAHCFMLSIKNDVNNNKINPDLIQLYSTKPDMLSFADPQQYQTYNAITALRWSGIDIGSFKNKKSAELLNLAINNPMSSYTLSKLNATIKKGLSEINAKTKYAKIAKLTKFKISFDDSTELDLKDVSFNNACSRGNHIFNEIAKHLKANMEISLNDADAKIVAEKEDKIKEFFPAFNDTKSSFKDLNKHMLLYPSHKVAVMHAFRLDDENHTEYFTMSDKIEEGSQKGKEYLYCLLGEDTNGSIMLSGKNEILKSFEIPKKVKQYNINNYHIWSKIESLKLNDDETVDLEYANDLKDIDVKNSSKYIMDNGVLYEKDKNEKLGKFVCALKKSGRIFGNGIKYNIITENSSGTKVKRIEVSAVDGKNHSNVEFPEFLTKMNVPIKIIGNNIESLILKGDTAVDLSIAKGLKSIDIKASTRYTYEQKDKKLVEKDRNTEIQLPENVKIKTPTKEITHDIFPATNFVQKDDIVDISTAYHVLEHDGKIVKTEDLQEVLSVPNGAEVTNKMLTLKDNDVLHMLNLRGMKYLNIKNSSKYIEKNGKLFSKKREILLPPTVKLVSLENENAKIKKVEGNDSLPDNLIPGDILNIENSNKYYSTYDKMKEKRHLFERVDDKKVIDKASLNGVQVQKATMVLHDDQILDISNITGPQYIDITNSERYEKINDHKIKDIKDNKEIDLAKNNITIMNKVLILKNNDALNLNSLKNKQVNYIDLSGSDRYYVDNNGDIFEKTKDKELTIPDNITIVNKTVTLQGNDELDMSKIKAGVLIRVVTKDVGDKKASSKYALDTGSLIELGKKHTLPDNVKIIK